MDREQVLDRLKAIADQCAGTTHMLINDLIEDIQPSKEIVRPPRAPNPPATRRTKWRKR